MEWINKKPMITTISYDQKWIPKSNDCISQKLTGALSIYMTSETHAVLLE